MTYKSFFIIGSDLDGPQTDAFLCIDWDKAAEEIEEGWAIGKLLQVNPNEYLKQQLSPESKEFFKAVTMMQLRAKYANGTGVICIESEGPMTRESALAWYKQHKQDYREWEI